MGAALRSTVKGGLTPIAPPAARLIILGSLPGDASLAAGQYYAHPSNHFWRLMSAVTGAELGDLDYAARLAALAAHGIGLWDAIGAAQRRGSLDQAIRAPQINLLREWIDGFPSLQAVAFNGQTAAAAGRRVLGARPGLALIDLPSSSAANTMAFAAKRGHWLSLRDYCG